MLLKNAILDLSCFWTKDISLDLVDLLYTGVVHVKLAIGKPKK